MYPLESSRIKPNLIDEVNDIGYVMVRPDGLKLGLDEEIIKRITGSSLLVLKRKLSIITPGQVDDLYPDLHERSYYQFMKQELAGKKVMSLIVGGYANVSNTLSILKGSALHTSGSVRGDYSMGHLLLGEMHRNYTAGCLSEEQLRSPEWSLVMREDRMHSDVTTEEAVNSINVMFTGCERNEVLTRFPSLHNLLASSAVIDERQYNQQL